MRRAAKADANQAVIVAALRAVGATIQSLASVGSDCPDLLVGFRSRNYIIEIKSAKGKLRPGQRVWMEGWKGQACVAHSPDEALRSIGAVK